MPSSLLQGTAEIFVAASFSEALVALIGGIAVVAAAVIPLVVRNRNSTTAPATQEQGERSLAESYAELITWADGPVSASHPPSEAASCIREAGDAQVWVQADQISTLRQQSYDAMKSDAWLGRHEDAVSELKRLVQRSAP